MGRNPHPHARQDAGARGRGTSRMKQKQVGRGVTSASRARRSGLPETRAHGLSRPCGVATPWLTDECST